jgi:hypothetical protein
VVYTFSNDLKQVPSYRGLALAEAIRNSQPHGSTNLAGALAIINRKEAYRRLIVLTDEQAHDRVESPKGAGYMINVAAYEHGVGDGPWERINGWSERTLDYIAAVEEDGE